MVCRNFASLCTPSDNNVFGILSNRRSNGHCSGPLTYALIRQLRCIAKPNEVATEHIRGKPSVTSNYTKVVIIVLNHCTISS